MPDFLRVATADRCSAICSSAACSHRSMKDGEAAGTLRPCQQMRCKQWTRRKGRTTRRCAVDNKRQRVAAVLVALGLGLSGCQSGSFGKLALFNRGDSASATPNVGQQKFNSLSQQL